MKSCSLGKTEHIRKSFEFKQVYTRGGKIVGRYFVIHWMERENGERRLGISVSKRVGNAVKRNYAKRLIRESFRLNKMCLDPGIDLVVVGRKGLVNMDFRAIEPLMAEAMKQVEQSRHTI